MWRRVFAYAVNPEVYLDADNIRSLLPKVAASEPPLTERLARLRSRAGELAAQWSDLVETLGGGRGRGCESEVEVAILQQSAPLASAFGAALQGLSAPCVFEDPVNLRLMALLADDVGAGAAERGRFDRFRDMCRACDLPWVAGRVAELADQREIRDGMFRLPATIYAMSRRSDVFDCELIGLDLAWRHVGLLPAWRALLLDAKRRRALDVSMAATIDLPEGASPKAHALGIAGEIARDPGREARLCHGVALFAALLDEMDALLHAIVRSLADPRLAMAILVQDRAREARIYHGDFKLEGRPLGDWFVQAQSDPIPLVDALGRSRLIRPGAPERSRLITGLIREDGAMFRIFSASDVAIIRRWINWLGSDAAAPGRGGEAKPQGEQATILPRAVFLSHDHRRLRAEISPSARGPVISGPPISCSRAGRLLRAPGTSPPRIARSGSIGPGSRLTAATARCRPHGSPENCANGCSPPTTRTTGPSSKAGTGRCRAGRRWLTRRCSLRR